MIRIRNLAATAGIAVAIALPASPALAQDAGCVDEAQGSAAGTPCEEEDSEVLDDVLERPDQAAPAVEDTLAVTGVGSAAMLLTAGGALALGGGAVVVSRRRSGS